jgi:hypothetical protein
MGGPAETGNIQKQAISQRMRIFAPQTKRSGRVIVLVFRDFTHIRLQNDNDRYPSTSLCEVAGTEIAQPILRN